MTDFGEGSPLAGETPRSLLERSRDLFAAHCDDRGIHLCEIALARTASDPCEAIAALLPPIERLAATRTLTGLDVIAAEALVAARALGARDLEARVRRLVAATGSLDLHARVFSALWDRVEDLIDAGELAGGMNAGWAALDLAVALDDFLAAAVSLLWLARCHEAWLTRTRAGGGEWVGRSDEQTPAHAEAASLCLEQAARYLVRAGHPFEAGELFLDAARQLSAGLAPLSPEPQSRARDLLDEAIRAYEDAGARDRVAECRIELARGHMDSGRPREAIRLLHKALSAIEGPKTLQTEVRAWEMLANAYRRAGDPDSATAAETRARLLADGLRTS